MPRKKQYEIIDAGDTIIYRDKKVEYTYDKKTGEVIGGKVFYFMPPRSKEEIERLVATLKFDTRSRLDHYPPVESYPTDLVPENVI
jgi:predicted metalloendopeptidase